jgi:hypothetical protein
LRLVTHEENCNAPDELLHTNECNFIIW